MSPELQEENYQDAQTAPVTETIYDADANQKLVFTADEEFEVVYHFAPVSDERYLEFDRHSRVKLVDDGTNILPDNAEALVKLWNDTVFDIEGIEGEKPSNWKDEIDADNFKIPSMTAFLAVTAFSSNKRVWGQTDSFVLTESYFNNEITQQKHFLRKKTIEDVKAFRKLQKIPVGGKGKGLGSSDIVLPANAEAKAAIYGKMQIKNAEGYASGRVPVWHRAAVVDYLFSSAISKKQQ